MSVRKPDPIKILQIFKSQTINFINDMISLFPEEGDLLVLKMFITDQANIADIVDRVVLRLNENNGEMKKMLREHNDKYITTITITTENYKESVEKFKSKWNNGSLDKKDKEMFWKYADTFILLCDRYLVSKQ